MKKYPLVKMCNEVREFLNAERDLYTKQRRESQTRFNAFVSKQMERGFDPVQILISIYGAAKSDLGNEETRPSLLAPKFRKRKGRKQ